MEEGVPIEVLTNILSLYKKEEEEESKLDLQTRDYYKRPRISDFF